MTGRHYLSHYTCRHCGKRTYTSRKNARTAAHRAHPGELVNAYRCPHDTDMWHIGHLQPGDRDHTPRTEREETPFPMEARFETITPASASTLLNQLAPNRNIRTKAVTKYAEDMAAGNWKLTGDPIRIDQDGRVIDGEHRLRAIVQAGVAIDTLVVYGVNVDARVAIDTGAKRTLADHLTFLGEQDTCNLAAALNVMWSRCHNTIYHKGGDASHQQLLALLREHPDIRASVKAMRTVVRQVRVPHGLAAALHYDMQRLPDTAAVEDTTDFWQRVGTGADMPLTHPVMQLRKRLIENAATLGRKVDSITIHAWIIKAWNAYRDGADMQALSWRRGGAAPEAFPVLR